MGIDELKFFAGLAFQALNALATAGVWLYVRYGDRNDEVDARFISLRGDMDARFIGLRNDMDARLDKDAADLSEIKASLRHSPTHSDLTRIHTRIDDVAGAIRRIEGEFASSGKTIDLIHSYLLNEGKRP